MCTWPGLSALRACLMGTTAARVSGGIVGGGMARSPLFDKPDSRYILGPEPRVTCYARDEGISFAGSSPIYLECDARAQAGSVAERVPAMAGRDLFRPARRHADREKHISVCVGVARRAAALSRLDWSDEARGAEAGVNTETKDSATGKQGSED